MNPCSIMNARPEGHIQLFLQPQSIKIDKIIHEMIFFNPNSDSASESFGLSLPTHSARSGRGARKPAGSRDARRPPPGRGLLARVTSSHVESRRVASSHVESRRVASRRVESRRVESLRVESSRVESSQSSQSSPSSHVESRRVTSSRVTSKHTGAKKKKDRSPPFPAM